MHTRHSDKCTGGTDCTGRMTKTAGALLLIKMVILLSHSMELFLDIAKSSGKHRNFLLMFFMFGAIRSHFQGKKLHD